MELRARTALQVVMNPQWYNRKSVGFCAPLRDDASIVFAEYEELCRDLTTLGDYCDTMSVLALSAVIGALIQSYFLLLTTAFSTQPLTRCIVGRGISSTKRPAVTIM